MKNVAQFCRSDAWEARRRGEKCCKGCFLARQNRDCGRVETIDFCGAPQLELWTSLVCEGLRTADLDSVR